MPDEAFAPAPAGTKVRWITIAVMAFFVVLIAVNAVTLPRTPTCAYWIGLFAPLAGVPIVAFVGWASRIRGLRLTGSDLVVERVVSAVRFSLEGLVSAVPDRDPLAGARKVTGNGGIGAVAGKFRSRRLGEFRAYLSDREYGVVVRTAAGTLVVSPAQPGVFVDAVMRRSRQLAAPPDRALS